jgi:hypothetical protein
MVILSTFMIGTFLGFVVRGVFFPTKRGDCPFCSGEIHIDRMEILPIETTKNASDLVKAA